MLIMLQVIAYLRLKSGSSKAEGNMRERAQLKKHEAVAVFKVNTSANYHKGASLNSGLVTRWPSAPKQMNAGRW